MSSCQYRRRACILATRHGSHMLQGERSPQEGDNLQPACSSNTSAHTTAQQSALYKMHVYTGSVSEWLWSTVCAVHANVHICFDVSVFGSQSIKNNSWLYK